MTTGIISGSDITAILESKESDQDKIMAATDKWLGVNDEGTFPQEIIDTLNQLDTSPALLFASPTELFTAGFVAALAIVEEKTGAIE